MLGNLGNDVFIVAGIVAVGLIVARILERYSWIPTTVLLVLFGILASFLPAVPDLRINPEMVLAVFIPPLIYYYAAFLSAPRETKSDIGPIAALGVGLTLVSAVAVAFTAHLLLPGIGGPAALALGAAVAPTDANPARVLLARIGLPHRVLTRLEGETMINEGFALALFAVALEWLRGASFSVASGLFEVGTESIGGIILGLAVASLVMAVRRRVHDAGIHLVLSLATPFLAHHLGEEIGLSGPLATAAAGMYIGIIAPRLHVRARATERLSWSVFVFVLGGAMAVLLGLRFRGLLDPVSGYGVTTVVTAAAAVVVVVVAVRMLWVTAAAPLIRMMPPFRAHPGRRVGPAGTARAATGHSPAGRMDLRRRLVVGLGGVRGALTIALALSIPVVAGGANFPARQALIVIAVVVVLATGFGQIGALALFGRALARRDRVTLVREEAEARHATANAALEHLDRVARSGNLDRTTLATQRYLLGQRMYTAFESLDGGRTTHPDPRGHQDLRAALVHVQREKLLDLYSGGEISALTLRSITHELDMEDPESATPFA